MAYAVSNFKTKKALKEAVAAYLERTKNPEPFCGYSGTLKGTEIRCYQPGLGPDLSDFTGKICLEGPHYPAAHTWYAHVEMSGGRVIKVLS